MHARKAAGTWVASPIAGLAGPAAASGVAAARDNTGGLHVVTQDRARTVLRHVVLPAASGTWQPGAVPAALPAPTGAKNWWMQLHMTSANGTLVLFGLTAQGGLASTVLTAGGWSMLALSPAPFCAARPLTYAVRGNQLVIIGVAENGEIMSRTLATDA